MRYIVAIWSYVMVSVLNMMSQNDRLERCFRPFLDPLFIYPARESPEHPLISCGNSMEDTSIPLVSDNWSHFLNLGFIARNNEVYENFRDKITKYL